MKTQRKPLHAVQRRLVEAVQKEYRRVGSAPPMQFLSDGDRKGVVAQNTLRTCVEACLEEMLPYGPASLADLAIRLASYVVSAAKEEDQPALIQTVVGLLPQVHTRRVNEGIRISTTWLGDDGKERSNYREDGIANDSNGAEL